MGVDEEEVELDVIVEVELIMLELGLIMLELELIMLELELIMIELELVGVVEVAVLDTVLDVELELLYV